MSEAAALEKQSNALRSRGPVSNPSSSIPTSHRVQLGDSQRRIIIDIQTL